MMLVIEKAPHCHSRMMGSLLAQIHNWGQAATWMVVAGKSSVRVLREGPKPAHVQLQQTCGADVRRRTIAFGSCCYIPLGSSRGCFE